MHPVGAILSVPSCQWPPVGAILSAFADTQGCLAGRQQASSYWSICSCSTLLATLSATLLATRLATLSETRGNSVGNPVGKTCQITSVARQNNFVFCRRRCAVVTPQSTFPVVMMSHVDRTCLHGQG